ncbi:MAG: hypothetical protein QXX30_01305 [Candidatus Aenigmatarchaeota archaeon]
MMIKTVEDNIRIKPPIINKTKTIFIPNPVKLLHIDGEIKFFSQFSAILFSESTMKKRPNIEKNIIKKAKIVVILIILFVGNSI